MVSHHRPTRHHRAKGSPTPHGERPNANARGYDHAWQKFRLWYLGRNPFCVRCSHGATEVDHIRPMGKGGEKFDESNLQALCKSCHSKKTRTEDYPG